MSFCNIYHCAPIGFEFGLYEPDPPKIPYIPKMSKTRVYAPKIPILLKTFKIYGYTYFKLLFLKTFAGSYSQSDLINQSSEDNANEIYQASSPSILSLSGGIQ
jgi:hypothetical protein